MRQEEVGPQLDGLDRRRRRRIDAELGDEPVELPAQADADTRAVGSRDRVGHDFRPLHPMEGHGRADFDVDTPSVSNRGLERHN